MTNPNYSHITLVVDRSGSMFPIAPDAEGGINSFIEEQKALPGKATLALFEFDDVITDFYKTFTDMSVATSYRLHPRGGTALYDAVGRAISETGRRLKAMKVADRPGKVVVVIVTDGQENSSKEYSHTQIAQMIKTQQDEYNWEFIFLGADLDTANVATGLNINNVTRYAPTSRGMHGTYSAMSSTVSAFRGSATATMPQMPTTIDPDGTEQ